MSHSCFMNIFVVITLANLHNVNNLSFCKIYEIKVFRYLFSISFSNDDSNGSNHYHCHRAKGCV